MSFSELKLSGITTGTPGKITWGAGTVHKGLTFSSGTFNFADSLIGATSGGNKVTITPEYHKIEVDGAIQNVKGLTIKVDETATLETNLIEVSEEHLKTFLSAEEVNNTDITGMTLLNCKQALEDSDYITNLGYVTHFLDGRAMVIIFENALCTSGLEIDGKAKEQGVIPATFECYASLDSPEKLPYKIYVEDEPTTSNSSGSGSGSGASGSDSGSGSGSGSGTP